MKTLGQNSVNANSLLPEDHKTIKRRTDVWFCANLSEWSPTVTSKFYNALTGAGDATNVQPAKPMTRQLAAKIMREIERDLPKKLAQPW